MKKLKSSDFNKAAKPLKCKNQIVKCKITNQSSKRKNIDHRVHRGIIVLKKEKNTENTEKKINKNSVLSVVKKSGS